MSTTQRSGPSTTPVSPLSEMSKLSEEGSQAMHMQRVDSPTAASAVVSPMPQWLHEEVAKRKRERIISKALALPTARHDDDSSENDLQDQDIVETQGDEPEEEPYEDDNVFVSEWLDGLPDRINEGWENVLREEVVQAPFGERRRSSRSLNPRNMSQDAPPTTTPHAHSKRETFFEDISSADFDYCPGVAPVLDDDYYTSDSDSATNKHSDDDFLIKVLLGRKRLMQAEISVKRLKMGLKHVTSGLCSEFTSDTDTERTRQLLAEVDATFSQVVRKRLSNATATLQNSDTSDAQKAKYRRRLRAMRDRDPGFILRVYSEREIKELKTMVADILGMDERSGDCEGTDWFWGMLPRLLELRGDMAEAEREIARLKSLQRKGKHPHPHHHHSSTNHAHNYIPTPLPVWDLYYHQYQWMQAALNFRPIGSWYAFSIPLEDEVKTEDWQLRVEQRVWLQEHFSLALGTRRWLPFRQGMVVGW